MTTILEAAARAMCAADELDPDELVYGYTTVRPCFKRWTRPEYKGRAEAVLRAAGFTDADMAAPVGSRVVVPREPTREMRDASMRIPHARDEEIYRAMIRAAAPAGTEGGA